MTYYAATHFAQITLLANAASAWGSESRDRASSWYRSTMHADNRTQINALAARARALLSSGPERPRTEQELRARLRAESGDLVDRAWTDIWSQLGDVFATGDRERAAVRSVTAVGNKDSAPAQTVLLNVHGNVKNGTEGARLLDIGFQADGIGNPTKALAHYAKAFPHIAGEIMEKLGRDTCARLGIDASLGPHAFLDAISSNHLESRIGSDAQLLLMKLFNRTGLAHKHLEEWDTAERFCGQALRLDPSYGAALYNLACIQLLGRSNVDRALDLLEKAVGDTRADYRKQARDNDVDWNPFRNLPRFRSIVGLDPLA